MISPNMNEKAYSPIPFTIEVSHPMIINNLSAPDAKEYSFEYGTATTVGLGGGCSLFNNVSTFVIRMSVGSY